MSQGPAAARYAALETYRLVFLNRARDCAALTIPYVMPPQGFNASQSLPTPYQSLGARGVRSLASKLVMALFPPNTPFFKYNVDDYTLQRMANALAQSGQEPPNGGLRGEVEKSLSSRERAIMKELEDTRLRATLFTSLVALLITGNSLLFIPPKGGKAKTFRLDQFVVKRDASGNVLEIIVKEMVARNTLPADVQKLLSTKDPDKSKESHEKNLELYTWIRREANGQWRVTQEAKGIQLPGQGTYPADKCPWIPLRLSAQPGEDYGRSYVEEYLGDLDCLEGLSETLVEGSAAVARIVFMVRPNGVTQLRTVAKARTGDVVVGDVNDVAAMQAEKSADLRVAREQAQEIATRLAYAFLLNTAIQRDGERVTAEEIRYMAQELDSALGGVYTLMGDELQLPVVTLLEWRLEQRKGIPSLPDDSFTPQLTTGIQALGRGFDLQNLKAFIADIIQIVGPELASRYIEYGELIKRAAAAYTIDTQGLIKSEEQIAQEEQMAQMQAMLQHLGPQAISQMGGMGKEMLKNQLQQETTPNG